jgi:uncharacterized protein YjbI with pentapeptide repeats
MPSTDFRGADLSDSLADRAVFVDANFEDAVLVREKMDVDGWRENTQPPYHLLTLPLSLSPFRPTQQRVIFTRSDLGGANIVSRERSM